MDFFDSLFDYLPEILLGGSALYGAYESDKNRDRYVDQARANEDRNYADSKANYDAYLSYLNGVGGGVAANNAAYAGAHAKQEQGRLGALGKGIKKYEKAHKQGMGMLRPYVQAGHMLLPKATKTYGNALDTMNLMNAYLSSPEKMVPKGGPAYQVNIPIPDYLKGAKK